MYDVEILEMLNLIHEENKMLFVCVNSDPDKFDAYEEARKT